MRIHPILLAALLLLLPGAAADHHEPLDCYEVDPEEPQVYCRAEADGETCWIIVTDFERGIQCRGPVCFSVGFFSHVPFCP